MQPREKLLLGVVGGLLALLAGNWMFNNALDGIKDRDRSIRNLRDSIVSKELKQTEGLENLRRLERLKQRSLPEIPNTAKAMYQHWLNELVNSKEVSLADWRVDWVRTSQKRLGQSVYHELHFTVHGQGTMAQLTNFLGKFYRADHLHKITQLAAVPVKQRENEDNRGKPKVLDLTVHIEALSLPEAAFVTELTDAVSPRLEAGELEQAMNAFLDRNFFDYNRAPRLEEIRDQKIARTKELRFRVRAEDPDLNRLTYEIRGIENAEVRGGDFRWTPPKDLQLGEYEAEVVVRDDGVPPRETTRKLMITVENAAPELSLRDKQFKWGDEVRVPLGARDPDGDSTALNYELTKAPPGAKIEEGEFIWLATQEAGEAPFDVEVEVAETGDNPLTTTASFQLELEIPPQPAFNHARFAVLTRVTEVDGQAEAKVTVRTLGENLLLKVGGKYEVGPLSFEVLEIDAGRQRVKIKSGDSNRTIRLGQALWPDEGET